MQNEGDFIPLDFDMLMVDIDGSDYHVGELSYDFKVSSETGDSEFNPTAGNDVIFIQESNIQVQQGSSLRAMAELALTHNYILVCTTAFNGFFVAHECMKEGDFDDFLQHTPPAAALFRALTLGPVNQESVGGTTSFTTSCTNCVVLPW